MRQKGVSEAIVIQHATRAALDHPPIQQFKAEADQFISDAHLGRRSMLVGESGEEGLSPEEMEQARREHQERSTRTKMANRSRAIMEGLAGLSSIQRLGLAGTAVEHRPITNQINNTILDELDLFIELARAEGNEDVASQVERRRNELASLRTITPDSETLAMF